MALIITSCVTLLGIICTVLIDQFEDNKLLKKKLKMLASAIAVVAVVIGYLIKNNEDKIQEQKSNQQMLTINQLKADLHSASDTINNISSTLALGQKANDSLKTVLKVINGQNDKLIGLNYKSQKDNLDYFRQNQTSIGDMSEKFGYRHLNQMAENKLTESLRPFKGTVSLQLCTSTQEAVAFKDQLDRIFTNAGWQVQFSVFYGAIMGVENKNIELMADMQDSSNSKVSQAFYSILSLAGYQVNTYNKKPEDSPIEIPFLLIRVFPYTSPSK